VCGRHGEGKPTADLRAPRLELNSLRHDLPSGARGGLPTGLGPLILASGGMKSITLLQIIAMGLPAVGYALAWWMQPQRRARRVLERAPGKRLWDVRDGDRVRLTGFVRRLRETVVSPVTGRRCVGFRYVIEERSSSVGDWHVVAQESTCVAFELVEEGVEAVVEGPFLFGLDFDDRGDVWSNLPPGLFGVLERARVPLSGPFGGEKEFRFREAVLRPDDRDDRGRSRRPPRGAARPAPRAQDPRHGRGPGGARRRRRGLGAARRARLITAAAAGRGRSSARWTRAARRRLPR
jgi:hypothetical protein